jgi:hypothetical protein
MKNNDPAKEFHKYKLMQQMIRPNAAVHHLFLMQQN